MTIFKIFLGYMVLRSIQRHCGANGYSIQYSESLSNLFDSTLAGCTTRTLLAPTSTHSGSIFKNLVTRRTNDMVNPKTYMIDQLFNHKIVLPMDRGYKRGIYPANYTQPVWQTKKYNLCYIHLYLINTRDQYATALTYHFLDHDVRRERPNFILFWDLCDIKLDLQYFFKWKESVEIFSDYRLYISLDSKKQLYNLSLMCVICFYTSETNTVQYPLLKSDDTSIHNLWKALHSNHKRQRRLTCYRCTYLLTRDNEGKKPLQNTIAEIFNVTINNFYKYYFDNNGYFSDSLDFTPSNIEEMFLARRTPSYTIVPTFLHDVEYKLVTVVLKSTMTRIGWTAIFTPFHNSLWISLLALAVFIAGLINKSCSTTAKLSEKTEVIFTLFRSLTGQGFGCLYEGFSGHILHLWLALCLYLAMFYGGDLAASMSTVLIPPYPHSIDELGVVKSNLRSLTVYLTMDKGVWIKRLLGWKAGESNRSYSIIEELYRTKCNNDLWEINFSKKYDPLRCRADKSPVMYESGLESPLTFIESEYRVPSVRLAFQSSPLFWVGPTSYLPDGQQVFPMVTSANYFGKLLHPFFSTWKAVGLESYWHKLRQYGKLKMKYFENQRIPHKEMRSPASNDFHPMRIESLTSIIVVIYVLAGIAAVTWVIEVALNFKKLLQRIAQILSSLRRIKDIRVQIIIVNSSAPALET